MKKILMCFVLVFVAVGFFGCDKSDDNISEITTTYLYAQEGEYSGSISIGKRENPYIIDGKHAKNVGFSLIVLKLGEVYNQSVTVKIEVNGQTEDVKLELNPLNSTYMADLGYALKEDDEISVIYNDCHLKFSNISKDFKVGWEKALEIGKKELSVVIDNLTSKKKLNGEYYLKILSKENNYNIVISVNDENVVYAS